MSPNHENNTPFNLLLETTCMQSFEPVNMSASLPLDSLTCYLFLLPMHLARGRLTFDYGKWVHFLGRQPHAPHSRSPLIWRITNVVNTSSVPTWAPLPLRRPIILTNYIKRIWVPEVVRGRDGLGREPQRHCPVCLVLATWVGCLHQNQ